MLQVNRIYSQLISMEISKQEASSLLLGEIFKSPRYYCMEQLEEDEISNFLLWIYDQIPRIIDNYKNKDSSFLTYYTSSIRYRYKSWKRLNIKKQVFQHILDNQHYLEYNEKPGGFLVADQDTTYSASSTRNLRLREPLTTKQAVTILVLALKTFKTLSSKVTEMIPRLTGISTHEFNHYINLIEIKMTKRLQKFEKIEKRTNASYVLCQQYTYELSTLDTASSQYDVVLQKYHAQQNTLNRLRDTLREFNLQPTNKMIEEVLCLPDGSVRRILSNADKKIKQILQLIDPLKN